MPVPRRLVFNAIAARISMVANATGYYGQIGRPIVLPAPVGWVADPPVKSTDPPDPRVKPYYILAPGPGVDGPDTALNDLYDGLDLDFEVRVGGGDAEDVIAVADRLDALLLGWIPTVTGIGFGRIGRFPGYRPPLLPDKTVSPERHFTPLKYVLTATT